jgi:IclR family KDG regulon transcriptional repressor
LIKTIHPYLEEISQKTTLSAFLGMRLGRRAVILDKADPASDLRISSEIGKRVPLIAGASGLALLSQLPDEEIDDYLSQNKLERFTRFSCVNKKKYREMIKKAREDGIAIDREEYVEGVRALAVPLNINRRGFQLGIWTVGLKRQIEDEIIPQYSSLLKEIAKKIQERFSLG